MSRKLSSPTAQLLRNSRLFSLPPPVPRPAQGFGASSEYGSASETATQPFPTRQAIQTPTSSLHRGDWGLKRPLPLRETTRSSAPTMRVFEVDTINLFTDFESAGDHVRTLEKWQELNMPLAVPIHRKTISGSNKDSRAAGAFDERIDNTHLTDELKKQGHVKWKYNGPWVSGMTEGDFESFLRTTVRKRKQAFREYLKQYLTKQAFTDATAAAREIGDALPDDATFEISEDEFDKRLKLLRENTDLSGELSRLISDFFDLPAMHESPQTSGFSAQSRIDGFLEENNKKGEIEAGPPTTHPSAGLSYLRSSAFLRNHPILGPQDVRPPVQARLLAARQMNNVQTQIKAGVGGVVAELKKPNNASRSNDKYENMRYDEHGGQKVWVTPQHASIDSRGNIKLAVEVPNEQDVQIKQGTLESKEEMETKKAPRAQPLQTGASINASGDAATKQSKDIVNYLRTLPTAGEGGEGKGPQ